LLVQKFASFIVRVRQFRKPANPKPPVALSKGAKTQHSAAQTGILVRKPCSFALMFPFCALGPLMRVTKLPRQGVVPSQVACSNLLCFCVLVTQF
jgi:hypothetical protein